MKKNYLWIIIILVVLIVLGTIFFVIANLDFSSSSSGSYSCTYETRHTGCGGVTWTDWTKECYSFDIDDYKEDWTPERVCNKYTSSDTNCGGSCCIEIEYRNNVLPKGSC
jgi:hypothetical protein